MSYFLLHFYLTVCISHVNVKYINVWLQHAIILHLAKDVFVNPLEFL